MQNFTMPINAAVYDRVIVLTEKKTKIVRMLKTILTLTITTIT